MPQLVAFLRAINVGGRFIKMADLAAHFEALGFAPVSTFINSGNVLFSARARSLPKLATSIETSLEPLLGFKSEVFLRTEEQVHALTEQGVKLRRSVPASGEVNVVFLAAPLTAPQASALRDLKSTMDDFVTNGCEVYWLCQGNQMQSQFSNALLERRLRIRCTFRRVSMLEKLSARLRATATERS